MQAPGTSATSATSLTIGAGSQSLTLSQTGKAFALGQFVAIASTANPANYMIGQISAFTSGTGALTVTVNSGNTGGSGTYSDWTVSLAAVAGITASGTATLTNKSLTTPVLTGTASGTATGSLGYLSGVLTFGDGTVQRTLVTTDNTQTLTNKTFDAGVSGNVFKLNGNTFAASAGTATLTLPNLSDTLVGRATTDTLTNKTINFANNTVTMTLAQLNTAISDGDVTGSWTQIATSTPTAVASVTFSSIPTTYQDLLIVFDGISHDNGTPTSFGVAVSVDGTYFSASTPIAGGGAGTIANTSTMRGSLMILGYLKGHGTILGGIANISSASDNVEAAVSGGNAGVLWRATTGISAVRMAWGAGNYDAGTITIYGK